MDWTPMDPWTHGLSWTSMDVDGVPQKSMEFHQAQWRSVSGNHISCFPAGIWTYNKHSMSGVDSEVGIRKLLILTLPQTKNQRVELRKRRRDLKPVARVT